MFKNTFVPIICIRRSPTASGSSQVKTQNIKTTLKTELTIIVHNIQLLWPLCNCLSLGYTCAFFTKQRLKKKSKEIVYTLREASQIFKAPIML